MPPCRHGEVARVCLYAGTLLCGTLPVCRYGGTLTRNKHRRVFLASVGRHHWLANSRSKMSPITEPLCHHSQSVPVWRYAGMSSKPVCAGMVAH